MKKDLLKLFAVLGIGILIGFAIGSCSAFVVEQVILINGINDFFEKANMNLTMNFDLNETELVSQMDNLVRLEEKNGN